MICGFTSGKSGVYPEARQFLSGFFFIALQVSTSMQGQDRAAIKRRRSPSSSQGVSRAKCKHQRGRHSTHRQGSIPPDFRRSAFLKRSNTVPKGWPTRLLPYRHCPHGLAQLGRVSPRCHSIPQSLDRSPQRLDGSPGWTSRALTRPSDGPCTGSLQPLMSLYGLCQSPRLPLE